MTDRELLELAAKAWFGNDRWCWSGEKIWNYVGYMDTAVLWNPLTDDGDALRLAVKLGINCWRDEDIIWCNGERFGCSDDPCATVRYVIVRAAAEIGKEQP